MDSPNKFVDEFWAKKMFHCAHCKELLQPPVMLVANLGNICHRCYDEIKSKDNMIAVENTFVTATLEEIEISCENKSQGCSKRIHYKEFQEHKDQCFYQSFSCKAPVDCPWKGNLKDFIIHYREAHEDYHLQNINDQFELSEDLKAGVYFLKTSYGDFFLNVKRTDQDVKTFIHSISDILQDLRYDFSIEFNKKISFTCHIVDWKPFFTARYVENDTPKINLELLKSMLQDDIVSVRVILNVIDTFETIGSTLLDIIKCKSCHLYIKYGPHTCQSGHNFCSTCVNKKTSKKTICTMCTSQSNLFCSPALETIIETVRLPCRFRDQGCNIKMPAYIDHDFSCNYKQWKCFFGKCEFIGPSSALNNHIYQNHMQEYYEYSSRMKIRSTTSGSYYLSFDNLLFHLFFEKNRSGDTFMWTMRIIGYKEPHEYYYYYEIEFQNGDRHIIFRAPCTHELEMSKNSVKDAPEQLLGFLCRPQLEMSKNSIKEAPQSINTITVTNDILNRINYNSPSALEYELRILKNPLC